MATTKTTLYSGGHLPSLPMATGSVVTQMESVLSATLTDLHVRNEVGDCIQGMLLDIETTFHLQQQLELESTQRLLEKVQTEQQGVILEAHTERLERYNRRVDLADHFVIELLNVNREMKELLEWKENHEYKVRNYDSLLAKLTQTEEELREANRAKPQRVEGRAAEATETDIENDHGKKVSLGEVAQRNVESTQATESIPEETPEENSRGTTMTREATESSENVSSKKAEKSPTVIDENVEETIENSESVENQKSPPTSTAVVSIDVEANIEEDVPTLLTLDVEPLMMVFGFLDAMDILNTAQINLTMYNKVDNIFGISEDGQSPPAPTPSRSTPSPPEEKAEASLSSQTTTKASISTTIPSPAKGNSSASAGPSSASATAGVMGKGLFSMLQPSKPEAVVTPTAKASNFNSSSGHQQSQPLNAKVAQSMASKLSDAELAAIISMTDKLSKLEKEVHMLRNEKEVFAGKLEGTEAVKQFLIGKVRDVEVKLQRSKEDEIKVTQQIASDQEVIAFLDSRVQDLEQQTETLTLEKTGTQAGLDELKVSSSKKITMLSDMLKYEREKLREDESDWKATKKVLVKEVKSCRAQILALQAERDGLKEQNDMLKRAIVSTGSGASGGGRKSSGNSRP